MKSFIFLVFVFIPSVCFSAPDKYTQYLMNEPVSLHDFAIFSTNLDLEDLFTDEDFIIIGFETIKYNKYPQMVWIDYDYDNDSYIVFVNIFILNLVKHTKPKDIAEYFIDRVRANLGYIITKDKKSYYPILGHSTLSSYMGHWGYTKKSEIKDLKKNIDKKISIKLTLNIDSREIICKTTPTDIKVYCSE